MAEFCGLLHSWHKVCARKESGPDQNRCFPNNFLEECGDDDTERVNIRVPMALIRAGVKLASLIPSSSAESVNEELRKKGINFDIGSLKAEDLEPLVDALQDLEVDVEDGHHKVRVFVE